MLTLKKVVVKYSQKDQLLHDTIGIFHLIQVIFLFLLLNLNNHQLQKGSNKMQEIATLMLKNKFKGFPDNRYQQIVQCFNNKGTLTRDQRNCTYNYCSNHKCFVR
ncbi:unnamed protein product [Paramecium octaurelia]|uniref:Transmembrane protein n=1 Tax=Paramecium octaurelia TaxID=43137 RepID=A0A8S1TPJ2_PAROT|nr:unnamed protein product [Paramecium octaurelia]